MLVVSMLALSGLLLTYDGDDTSAKAVPVRASGEDLLIENETYTLELTGDRYQEFDKVQLMSNSTLEIIGGTLKAKTLICRGDAENTTLRLVNYEDTPGLISITEGIVNVKATSVEVVGSSISVINGTSTLPNGEEGGSSEILLLSKGSDLRINGSELNVRGHNGGLGDQGTFGGAGGDAKLHLGSKGDRSVDISGSTLTVEGGAGGDAYANGIVAGEGGDAELKVYGHGVSISSSEIFSKGGKGGGHSAQSQGDDGGETEMRYEADQDLIVHATDMDAVDGLDSDLQEGGASRVLLTSKNAVILWDHEKSQEEKKEVLSHVNADIFQTDAKNGAKLHQVESPVEPPRPFGDTHLEVYWWAEVKVKDLYGRPLEGASVTWTIDPDPVPYPREGEPVLTDENGELDIEVVGKQDQDLLRFTFYAEITGGAKGNSDQVRFRYNQNEKVDIIITRMLLEIVRPDLNGLLGGQIHFEGTAQPGNDGNTINNVTLYLDEEVIGYAEDISEEGSPPYSVWYLNWDSSDTPDGMHTLSMVGTDDSYTVRVDKRVEINYYSVNHQPRLHSVIITDVDGQTIVQPTNETEVHVDQEKEENAILAFEVEVYEEDVLSEILGPGEGKSVVEAAIELTHTETDTNVIEKGTLVIGEDSIEKYNLSGGFQFSFTIDTMSKPGTNDPYDEGRYKVVFHIKDDGGLVSTFDNFIFFDLQFDFYPFVDVFIEPNKRSGEDATSTHESFILETPKDNDQKGSDKLTVTFNLTDCWDRDDPLWSSEPIRDRSWSNLKFTVQIRDHNNNRETVFGPDAQGASFDHTFDVGDIPDGDEAEFVIVITAKDQQGLETEYTVLARVTRNAPEDPTSIVDDMLGTDSIHVEYNSIFYIFPALLVLMLLAYLGVLVFIQAKNNKDKMSKMAILDRRKEQVDKEKEPTTIEDEVNIGIKDSKKYLEATGAGKGRDEFLKELEEARSKEESPGAAAPESSEGAPQQEPPAPEQKPPQQAPPKPPQDQRSTAAPQQPSPKPPQGPTPPAPPQQAPPPSPKSPTAPPQQPEAAGKTPQPPKPPQAAGPKAPAPGQQNNGQ